MTPIHFAQDRILDDARVAFLSAQAALDQAQAKAEDLDEVHLLPDDLAQEAIGAIKGMGRTLDRLIEAVESP